MEDLLTPNATRTAKSCSVTPFKECKWSSKPSRRSKPGCSLQITTLARSSKIWTRMLGRRTCGYRRRSRLCSRIRRCGPSLVSCNCGRVGGALTKGVPAKSGAFQINDSAGYLFDAVERIMDADFVPTDDDILRARVRTTGVSLSSSSEQSRSTHTLYRSVRRTSSSGS